MRKFTKSDAVNQFGFLPQVYNAVEGSGFKKDSNEYNLCGVIFVGNWAYISNNHFMGRMNITDDRGYRDPVYFDLRETAENKIIQGNVTRDLSENQCSSSQQYLSYDMNSHTFECRNITGFGGVIHNMHKLFFNFRENFIVLNRQEILDKFDKCFGRNKNEKIRCVAGIEQCPEDGLAAFHIRRINKQNLDHEFKFETKFMRKYEFMEGYLAPGICAMNSYYFYEILKSLECEEFELQYNNDIKSPVVIKGIKASNDQPEVMFAIAQASTKY